MLTLTFIILVYSVLLNNSDLNIIKATAQRWMLNGTAGIRYQIVFATKAFVKNISVDEIWINNKFYKVNSGSSIASVHFDNAENEKVLSVDLNEELVRKSADPVVQQMQKFLPGNMPLGNGDVVIVYSIGNKKKYHVISQVEKLPFAINGNSIN